MGAFQGDFSSKTASDLGAVAIQAAVERAGVKPESVEHVYFGNCLMAGQGQAPARQALIKAGLPMSTGAVTLSKMCGSAMQAAIFAYDQLAAGSADIVVAGGMESMTNAPYLIPKARGGYRIGHGMMFDHMMLDGLEDAYSKDEKTGGGRSMGTFAEECVAKYQFSREEQDNFAIASVTRAQEATKEGYFKWEMAPVTVSSRAGDVVVEKDEGRQDPVAETRLQEGRHRDRRFVVVDQRRRRGAGDDARVEGEGTGPDPDRTRRRPRHPCAGTEPVHHRADRLDAEAVQEDRLDGGRRGPVRD
jgi:acetyl-CoA C-acetyltransferase